MEQAAKGFYPDWETSDEASLIEAAKSERAALSELCARYSGRLYSYLRARTESDDDAADLTQQVLLKAIAALPRYRERGLPFSAWLFRIARNTLTDTRRRRRTTIPWDSLAHMPGEGGPDEVETIALRRETEARVRCALSDLPAEQRDLILLRFVAGLRLREIAALLGSRESTVHKKLKRALRTLQEYYDGQE